MEDFCEDNMPLMNDMLRGKKIKSLELDRKYDDFLVFNFTDGSHLRIKYDWIYEWEVA